MWLFFFWDERCRFEDCSVVEQGALVLGACRFFGWLVGCKWCGWRLGRFVQLAGLRKRERERELFGRNKWMYVVGPISSSVEEQGAGAPGVDISTTI